jgi:hypothetical protein
MACRKYTTLEIAFATTSTTVVLDDCTTAIVVREVATFNLILDDEPHIPPNAVLNEDGTPELTEGGQFSTTEA